MCESKTADSTQSLKASQTTQINLGFLLSHSILPRCLFTTPSGAHSDVFPLPVGDLAVVTRLHPRLSITLSISASIWSSFGCLPSTFYLFASIYLRSPSSIWWFPTSLCPSRRTSTSRLCPASLALCLLPLSVFAGPLPLACVHLRLSLSVFVCTLSKVVCC